MSRNRAHRARRITMTPPKTAAPSPLSQRVSLDEARSRLQRSTPKAART